MSILNFMMNNDSDSNAVRTTYRIYEETSHRLLTDRVTFIFIELPKFKKTIDELDGNILEGMYFCFKNMSALKDRPQVLDHQIFEKIFEVSELYNMDQDLREKVIHKMTTERDLRNQMAYAREEAIREGLAEGKAQGLEQGLEQGRKEQQIKIARTLKSKGLDISMIAECTGLTVEEIEQEQNQN